MEKLTNKEEAIMHLYWKHKGMFVRDLLEHYTNPKPHFNTLSTMVRALEAKGFLGHKAYGTAHQYYPLISENEYGKVTIKGAVNKYFKNSYLSAVSALIKEEDISIEELKELIKQIENEHK